MPWIKQGCIFRLEDSPNRSNHAQVPTPFVFDDFIRIYYACRNNGKAFVAYFDLAKDLKTILKVHEQPVFTYGKPGMFDADGVMPSCVLETHGGQDLYYIGWSELKNTACYQNEIGLARSEDEGQIFERVFDGPIVGRSMKEPGLAVMPFVIYKNWYRMWYQSLTRWELIDGKYEPIYVIKYAESTSGIDWKRDMAVCVKQEHPLEAHSRPTVVIINDKYCMWFCYRDSADYRNGKGAYRIGYAESDDGINFERMDDKAGITVGSEGEFDSDMICYPYVIEIEGKLVMFYNGNSFGQTGIGVAVYEH